MPAVLLSTLLALIALAQASSEVGTGGAPSNAAGLSETADQRHRCRELELDKPKQVSLSREQGTGLPARYQITKTADKTFRVDLNVHFGPDATFGEKEKFGKDAATVAEYIERVDRHYRAEMKKCLAASNPRLVDPDGQRIEIRINDKFLEPTHFNGESSFIAIGPRKYDGNGLHTRDSKRVYTSNVDCPTMIHELMHLLGLCDEYPERTFAKKIAGEPPHRLYNCRALGPMSSVMNNSGVAMAGLTTSGPNGTPLRPAHVRAIVFGGCEAKNKLYYACAKHAYTTAPPGRCPAMPEECKDPLNWLK